MVGPAEDLPRRGGLLQPRPDVDLCPDHDAPVVRGPHRHLAGVDPDPDLHRRGEPEGLPQPLGAVAHREGGANGADRVVVAGHGHPEHAEDRVADEALRDAPQPGDLLAHHRVEGDDHLAEPLGVDPGGELGGAGQVDEDDRDDPPLRCLGHGHRRPAVRAEVGLGRDRLPAARARGGAHRAYSISLDGVRVRVAERGEACDALDLAGRAVERHAPGREGRARRVQVVHAEHHRPARRELAPARRSVEREPDAPCLELGPIAPRPAREGEPHDLGVEPHGSLHVAGPVVDVIDGPQHAEIVTEPPRRAGTRGQDRSEDLRLLRGELFVGQDPVGVQAGETLQLAHGARRHRRSLPASLALVHALLVQLTLVVDRPLDALGVAHVLEHLAPLLRGGLDHQRARPHDPVEDPLLEPHVVDRLERDLHRVLRESTQNDG